MPRTQKTKLPKDWRLREELPQLKQGPCDLPTTLQDDPELQQQQPVYRQPPDPYSGDRTAYRYYLSHIVQALIQAGNTDMTLVEEYAKTLAEKCVAAERQREE